MSTAVMVEQKTVIFPLPDGRRFIVTPFGDAIPGKSGNGWAVVDITIENLDGTRETLYAAGTSENKVHPELPGKIRVFTFGHSRDRPQAG